MSAEYINKLENKVFLLASRIADTRKENRALCDVLKKLIEQKEFLELENDNLREELQS